MPLWLFDAPGPSMLNLAEPWARASPGPLLTQPRRKWNERAKGHTSLDCLILDRANFLRNEGDFEFLWDGACFTLMSVEKMSLNHSLSYRLSVITKAKSCCFGPLEPLRLTVPISFPKKPTFLLINMIHTCFLKIRNTQEEHSIKMTTIHKQAHENPLGHVSLHTYSVSTNTIGT